MQVWWLGIGLLVISASSLFTLTTPQAAFILLSSLVSGWFTMHLIPKTKQFMLRKNISGLDLNKKGTEAGEKPIPECIGFAAAVSFIMVALLALPILHWTHNTHLVLTVYAILVSVLGTILLGFADDMLDLLWRYKLLFPLFLMIPVISVYQGVQYFEVIWPFSIFLGPTLYLGPFFLFYITCLCIYKTNTINIFAGINGLEVGQSIVAASLMVLYFGVDSLLGGKIQEGTILALWILLIFLGGAIVLLRFNQFPAQIFIGDTFCYYAGIILAIAGIFGQIPVVCHWFMVPQLINFLYSTPQLFGFKHCPRHRLPKYNSGTGLLQPVEANMNLLNLALRVFGPTHESSLCLKMLLIQGAFGLIPIVDLLMR